jgi:hypothetical protein
MSKTKGGNKSEILVINNTIANLASYCYTITVPFGNIFTFLPKLLGGEFYV